MLLVKPWWDFRTEFIFRIRTEGINFSLKWRIEEDSYRTVWRKRSVSWISFTDWFGEVSSPLTSQQLVLSCCLCACYLLFDLKRLDCWRRFLVLLVIDVIKPPGTYFNNCCSFLVDLRSSALLSPLPAFFCMVRWIQVESQQSVLNFSQTDIAWQVRRPARFLQQTIDLCSILYNKTCIVATFFSQRTTAAFELFFIERTYTSDILF